MTNDDDYLTRSESCRKAADKSTLLPFSLPQYQQPLEQSVRMLEGMSRPSIRVECVKYFVSKQHCLLLSYNTQKLKLQLLVIDRFC